MNKKRIEKIDDRILKSDEHQSHTPATRDQTYIFGSSAVAIAEELGSASEKAERLAVGVDMLSTVMEKSFAETNQRALEAVNRVEDLGGRVTLLTASLDRASAENTNIANRIKWLTVMLVVAALTTAGAAVLQAFTKSPVVVHVASPR